MPDAQVPQARPVKPLTEEQVSAWRARLSAGRDVSKELIAEGRKHVGRYQAKTLRSTPQAPTVVVPLDFASVEQKKAQLFKVPEIIAEADTPEAEPAAPLVSAIANKVVGPKGVNAGAMMFEAQTDVLIHGYAVTKIGYENVVDGVDQVPTGEMQPDPNAPPQPGAVLGLGAQPPLIPVTVPVPKIISETYYWRRIPPGFLGAPVEFRGSNFDDAAALWWRFEEDLPDGAKGGYGSEKNDELLLVAPTSDQARKTPKRCGTEVWYYASKFDPSVKHPDIVRTFKLYDDEPIARDHRDSPFQRWTLGDGQVLPSYVSGAELVGMKGFPLHVLTLRYLSDTAFPPSDVQMGGPTSDELSLGRTQLVQRRNRSLPQVLVDKTRVGPETLALLERNDNTGFVGVDGNPNEMFLPLNKGQFGRENFEFNQVAQQDYDRTWALGAHGGTLKGSSPETATKSNQIQQSVQTRLEAERSREADWFIAGVTKLMGLYQVFADRLDHVRILGADGTARFEAWDKTKIPVGLAFTLRPNSHVRLDAESDFRQELDFFNLAGNAPEGNRLYMLQRLAAKRGMDPMKALQAPPPKTPDIPKTAFSVKGEDLIGPQAPLVLEMLQQLGFQFSAEAIAASQQALALMGASQPQGQNPETEHGGSMEGGGEVSPINKHTADLTGGMQGIGVQ